MPKEEMNAFDVRALADELQLLEEGRFDKAFQPSDQEVVLRFYVPSSADEDDLGGEGTRKDLAVLSGRWACLTEHPRENPTKPPGFSMKLRKHLAGGAVLDVRQAGFDRVLEITVGKRDATYTLVVELFHDGNVILVERRDEDGDHRPRGPIVDVLRAQEWAHRTLRPGRDYEPAPPRTDPAGLDYEGFRERVLDSDADVVRTLAVELNLGGTYAEEVCARWGGGKGTPVKDLLESDLEELFDAFQAVLDPFRERAWDPVIAREPADEDGEDAEGEAVDVAPRPLAAHEELDLERFGTFNAALDAYFSRPLTEAERRDKREAFEEERARVERKLEQQERALGRFDEEEVEAQRKGDLLYARFDVVERILTTIQDAAGEHGWDAVKERLEAGREAGNPDAERVVEVNPHAGQVRVELDDVESEGTTTVTLDVRQSVQGNAEALYESGKQARRKRAGAEEALEETREQLEALEREGEELLEELARERASIEPTHRFWFERYRWFVSSDGHLVIGGRDASTNDRVVKDHLEAQDRYAHADVHGAPSVVVKADDGETPPEATLEEACRWAVSMSSAWKSGAASGDAYWVTPPQVSQTPESGEFLPKGAFIVRGQRNHVSGALRIAVGEVEVEGHRKVMGAPPAAVTDRSDRYVVLEPGREDRNALANRLSEVLEVPVEEVQAVLPPGDVRIVEVHGLPEDAVRGGDDEG